MFATAQSRVKKVSDENIKAKKTKEVVTKKRAALGDVSNVQPGKVVAKGNRVTRSQLKKVEEKVVAKVQEPTLKKAKTVTEWDDLDAEDMNDPVMVSEYVNEIFEYMKELELQTLPNPEYMDMQKELQWKMRTILIDWLIEVHQKFRLLPETLYLTINIIDRFLSVRVVSLVKLQLVGITAMFIASKYEEVMAPSCQTFLYMTDGGYSEEEILRAERYVLQVLDFSLQYPSPMSFLRRCSKADLYDIQTRTLAKYLMEVTILDHNCMKMGPSLIAAASLFLARHMLNRGEWHRNLVHYSGYEEKELHECCDYILEYLRKPTKQEALFKKYSSRKFMKASIFVKDWLSREVDFKFDAKEAKEVQRTVKPFKIDPANPLSSSDNE